MHEMCIHGKLLPPNTSSRLLSNRKKKSNRSMSQTSLYSSPDAFLRALGDVLSAMNGNDSEVARGGSRTTQPGTDLVSLCSSWTTAEEGEGEDLNIKGCAARKDDDNEDDISNLDSPTSTEAYEHESFTTFQHRVINLCEQIWPFRESLLQKIAATRPGTWLRNKCTRLRKFLPAAERHVVTARRGGSYNRIIGVSIEDRSTGGLFAGPTPEPVRDMILRVPRNDWARPDREVALLDFIRSRTSKIPLPEVVEKDFVDFNPLGKPYVLYQRVPGQDLLMKWDDMTHAQRCSIARDLARIYKEMLGIKHEKAGTVDDFVPGDGGEAKIVPMTLQTMTGPEPETFQWEEIDMDEPGESEDVRYKLRSYYFFRNILARRRATDMLQYGEKSKDIEVWDHLIELLRDEMRQHSFLRDVDFSLCHLDLQARNIMADTSTDGETAHITGILDWDSAVLAPQFINCTPPWWMWVDVDTWFDESDEAYAGSIPLDPQKAQIKRIFDAECGPTFFKYAYQPEYRLGRTLFRLIESGMSYDQQWKNLTIMCSNWADMYEDLRCENGQIF